MMNEDKSVSSHRARIVFRVPSRMTLSRFQEITIITRVRDRSDEAVQEALRKVYSHWVAFTVERVDWLT